MSRQSIRRTRTYRKSTGKTTRRRPSGAPVFEPLEPRVLLSSVDLLALGPGAGGADESTHADTPEPGGPIAIHAAVADDGASAELLAANVTQPGATGYTFQVVFADDEVVDVTDLDGDDVRVTGPNGYGQHATLVGVDVDAVNWPIPNLDLWEQNMQVYGAKHGDPSAPINTWEGYAWYYDGEWAFYQIADYTGDDSWNAAAEHIENTYRKYVLDNNGQVPGYRVFPHGLYEDFIRTGDEESKRAVLLLATKSAFAHLGGGALFSRSRETAYAMQAYMYAEKLGVPSAKLPVALEFALGHMDQWFVSKTVTFMQPFMVGLTAHALIEYDEMYGDERIQPLLEKAADWLWENAWVEADESFYYQSDVPYDPNAKPERGSPDLNMLIAPMYAWLFKQTQDVKYLGRGDAAFAGGVEGAYLTGGKQFTQSYRLSFNYVQWRQAAPPKAAAASPQIAGLAASIPNTLWTATYSIAAPGGTWDHADNGTYTVSLPAGQASGTNGNFAQPGVLGTFAVAVPDSTMPLAELVAANVTARGASTYTFSVAYSDNEGVDVSDLDSSDVRVTGLNGFSQYATLAGVDVDNDGTPRTATYRITAPGDGWDIAHNGTYTVTLGAGQVSDTSGNLARPGELGTFNVAVAAPPVIGRFGSIDGQSGVRLTLPASNGALVTFALKGSGHGMVEGEPQFERITLVGTNSRSVLKVTSKAATPELGDIIVDGSIRSLSLKGVDLTGDIEVSGTLGSLTANNIVGPGTITIGPASSHKHTVTLRLNHLTDMSLDSATPIRSIIVSGWTDDDGIADSITAPSLDRLQVRAARRSALVARPGAFDAGLELTGSGTVLGAVRIANGLNSAVWNISGSVGKVAVAGDIENWTMIVGSNVGALQLGNVISADVEVGGSIGKAVAAAWADSSVLAANVNSAGAESNEPSAS